MKHVFRYLAILFFFFPSARPLCGEQLILPPETPFFEKPDIESKILFLNAEDVQVEILETREIHIRKIPVYKLKWHPIMVVSNFHRIELSEGVPAWVSEDFKAVSMSSAPVPTALPNPNYSIPVFIAIGLLVLLVAQMRNNGALMCFLNEPKVPDKRIIFSLLTFVVLIRIILVMYMRFRTSGMISAPIDENGYFDVAKGITDWTISEDWAYTVGLPLLYIPFIIFTGADHYLDIVDAFSVFNAYILSTGCLILVFFCIKKICQGKLRPALYTILLLTIIPFFYFPVEYHQQIEGVGQMHKAIFSTPIYIPASYWMYDMFLAVGYNGLSDTPSAFFLLLVIYLCLKLTISRKTVSLIAALFAFACLIRIANIFFSPLIAYLFWYKLRQKNTEYKEIIIDATIGLAVFIAVFSPQFMVNAHNYGSVMTFPYSLHQNRSAEGFAFDTLMTGVRFLINTNFIYMAVAASGLFFVRCKHSRTTLILWGLPIVVFYCGYPVIGTNSIRFILPVYGALTAAFLVGFPSSEKPKNLLPLVLVILSNLILISPTFRLIPPHPFLFGMTSSTGDFNNVLIYAIPLISVGIIWHCYKTRKDILIFSFTFLILFQAGSPWLIFALFSWHLLWAAGQFLISLKTDLKKPTGPLAKDPKSKTPNHGQAEMGDRQGEVPNGEPGPTAHGLLQTGR